MSRTVTSKHLPDALRVEPGTRVDLRKVDAAQVYGHEKAARREGAGRARGPPDRPPGAPVGGGQAALLIVLQGIDAAGKDGTIRHVMDAFNPQGCTVVGFKAPDARGAAPRLPVADPPAHSRPRDGRRSSTAATTRTCSSSGSTGSCPRRSGAAATARSTSSSGSSPRKARRSSSSSCTSTATSSASGSRRAWTTPTSAGSSRRRPPGARAWDDYIDGVPGLPRADLDRLGAVVSHPGQPQVVPQPRRRAYAGRDARAPRPAVPAGRGGPRRRRRRVARPPPALALAAAARRACRRRLAAGPDRPAS